MGAKGKSHKESVREKPREEEDARSWRTKAGKRIKQNDNQVKHPSFKITIRSGYGKRAIRPIRDYHGTLHKSVLDEFEEMLVMAKFKQPKRTALEIIICDFISRLKTTEPSTETIRLLAKELVSE